MTRRRRILHADKIIQNVIHVFCLLMFLQLKDNYTDASSPLLLYSTASDIRVADISKFAKVTTIIKGLEQGSAVDFLHRKDLICWSDQTAELIQCMKYNETYSGEKFRIVSEGLITPTGLAIDWYTEKIYWTDGETNRIEVISIEQRHRKVLFWTEVDLARAIAVVPKEGLMFWTDWGEIPKIERAGMNGDPSTRKVIVKDNIIWPNGITVDYDKNLIYWVDAKLQFVDVIDYNGLKRKRVVKGGLEYPYALAVFDDKLFWTDWKTWAIHSWDNSSSNPIKELIKSDPVPVDIKVFVESRQVTPDDYPCKTNNGGCSHLCLLSPNPPGYECACPTGVKLRPDSNTTCHSGPQSLLVVAQRSLISKISLDSPDFTPYPLPLKDLKRAISVDFDPKDEYLYWADSLAKTISRARLDGSSQSVVVRCGGAPDSLAVDPLARNLYWTDPAADTISVARLDHPYTKVLIHEDLYDPRAIALHPRAGLMFWSDWNERKPKIERASLDGSGRALLVAERVTWPNGLAVDVDANKLYWGDARTHKIEVCNLDGSGRTELHSTDILHIFGLTLLGEHLYWTDMQRRTLDRIDKNTGLDRQPVVEQMANMMGAVAFRLGGGGAGGTGGACDPAGPARCSHLCFNRPQGAVCSCPLGLELSRDKRTCVEPGAFLVYSRKNAIGLVSIESGRDNHALLPLRDLKEVSAIAVHVSASKIYWADSKTKSISRCALDGTGVERVIEWVGVVEGIAIDWSGDNIYWTDSSSQRIEVARVGGGSRRALLYAGLKRPQAIALDPLRGHMYWSELGSKSIKRANMDGSAPALFMEQVGRVHALSVDPPSRALYWAALDPPAVERAALAGAAGGAGARTLLANDTPMPYALALHDDTVFWGDWNTGAIESAKKTDGSNRKTIHTQLDYISDLKTFHRGRSAPTQCGADNGGCAHLCLPLPDRRYRCACPTHYRLNKDNITCDEPEEFLLYAVKGAVGRLVVAGGECGDAPVPLAGLRALADIQYDPVHRHLYYVEEDSLSIKRVVVSAAPAASSVVWARGGGGGGADGGRPAHIALDIIGRALYWTAVDGDSINATSIEGNITGVVVRGASMAPRHVAFHHTRRLLVWNDVGLGAIMRANVDGTARVELWRANNATALALDQPAATVYWAAARQIHAVHLDGRNYRVVWQGGLVSALGVYGGHVYVGAGGGGGGGGGALMRVALHRPDAPAAPVPHVPRPTALHHVYKVPRDHVCWAGRGGVCGAGPGACGAGGACGCGVDCAPPPPPAPSAPACPHTQYACAATEDATDATEPACIPIEWKCDGQADCADGSDEGAAAGCGACGGGGAGGGVRCAGGGCERALADCPAGALCGELDDTPDAFRCDGERLCLDVRLLCDRRAHCQDGSDEHPHACQAHLGGGAAGVTAGGARQSSAFLVCGSVVGCLAGVAGLWAGARRWRGRRAAGGAGAGARGAQYPGGAGVRLVCKPHTEDRPSSGSLATDSLCARYRPTANPPPSPATAPSPPPPARRRPYRHYRASNRPPPPTPASTDAGESEPERERAAPAPPPSPAATEPRDYRAA